MADEAPSAANADTASPAPHTLHTLFLRIPEDLYQAAKAQAKREHRSLNGQLSWLIERWLRETQGAL